MRVVDPAWPPPAPSTPTLPQSVALGMLGGLTIGMGFVFWREYLGTAFRNSEEAARFLQVPELGAIPPQPIAVRMPALRQIEAASPSDAVVQLPPLSVEDLESYRVVMASLACAGWNSIVGCCIVVTSPGKGDGKTRTTASLGIALAKAGRKTLLIGGDLRQPELHNLFGIGNDRGLRDLLEEGSSPNPEGSIQPTGVANLDVMPSGPPVVDSMHLLDSQRLPELLRILKKRYDMILIDSPPVLQLADARMLARLSQGTILVVRAGHTSREAAQAARVRLANDGIEVAGVVLNDSPIRDNYYRYKADGYGRSKKEPRG
jgi:capsular exopolysaccharide synthesis family protein